MADINIAKIDNAFISEYDFYLRSVWYFPEKPFPVYPVGLKKLDSLFLK